MRVIFEDNVENSDFIEIIINESEYEKLIKKGIAKDFPLGLYGKRNLNVYVRIGHSTKEDEDASSKRESS